MTAIRFSTPAEAKTYAAGMKLVAAKLAAARKPKQLPPGAAKPVPLVLTAANLARFKQAIKTAIKPTLLEAIKAKATPPARPAAPPPAPGGMRFEYSRPGSRIKWLTTGRLY